LAGKVIEQVRSIGVALSPPTVPHAGEPSFVLADDEIEFGIGIHGEPGRERIPAEPADALVERLVTAVVDDLPFARGDRVLLFTNSMGGTPLLELYLAHGIAERSLADRGITVERRLVGPFITSLEMQGMSLTLLKLDDDLTELWDAPVNTPALRWGI
jgi:dihydroxyacetone kinase-like protein